MAREPVISVIQDSTFLLQKISESRLQVITKKFKPSRFCFFLIKCEAYRKGLTPAFFKTIFPEVRFFWDEIFTCIKKHQIVSTGAVVLVVKRKRAKHITIGDIGVRDLDGKRFWIYCEKMNYQTFVDFMSVNRKCMAEFPPPPEGYYRDTGMRSMKSLSPESNSPVQDLDDLSVDDDETENQEISSQYVPKKLVPVDLSIASLIIEKISQNKLCKVAMVYLDCLYRKDVTFDEIYDALEDIFGPISEDCLFVRSDTSHMGSGATSPNGSCFIICKHGEVLDDEMVKRKLHERRINFGEFKVQTIARAIIDGKILMFTKGMLRLGVKFSEIFGFDPTKLPKLTRGGRSILTRSNKTPFGQLGNMPLLNGFILPTILTKADLIKPDPTKLDLHEVEKISTTTSVNKKSNEATHKSVATTMTITAKTTVSQVVRPSVEPIIEPPLEPIEEPTVEPSIEPASVKIEKTITKKPCPKAFQTQSKSNKTSLVGTKSEISGKISKLEQDLLRKCLAEEERNEFVGERLEKAHKQGNVVIAIRKTPPEWSVCELKQLFGLKKLENERVLAMYTQKKTGRALNNLRLILNNPEDTQKILSCDQNLVAGKRIQIRRSDFKEYEIWLKYNCKNIKTLDR